MRGLFSSPKGAVLLLLAVALLLYVAGVTIPAANCEARARGMQTNYYFHPLDGCFLQNGAGDWYRVDAITINQP